MPIYAEPRKVTRTGHISCYGQLYRVPDAFFDRRMRTVLIDEHFEDRMWQGSNRSLPDKAPVPQNLSAGKLKFGKMKN